MRSEMNYNTNSNNSKHKKRDKRSKCIRTICKIYLTKMLIVFGIYMHFWTDRKYGNENVEVKISRSVFSWQKFFCFPFAIERTKWYVNWKLLLLSLFLSLCLSCVWVYVSIVNRKNAVWNWDVDGFSIFLSFSFCLCMKCALFLSISRVSTIFHRFCVLHRSSVHSVCAVGVSRTCIRALAFFF